MRDSIEKTMAATGREIADRQAFLAEVAASSHLGDDARAELVARTEREIADRRETLAELAALLGGA